MDEWHAATYKLTYRYSVDSIEYFVTSSYSTSFVPTAGTPSEILYNPKNPDEAVISGPNKTGTTMIFMGIFFAVCPLLFFMILTDGISSKHKSKTETHKKATNSNRSAPKADFMGILFGLIYVLVGYGSVTMISNSFSISGIINYYLTSFTLWMLIPLFLITAGLFTLIKSIFSIITIINNTR